MCAAPGVFALSPEPADSLSTAVGTVLGNYIGESLSQMRSLGLNVDRGIFIRTMEKMLLGEPTGFTVDEANAWLDRYIASTRPHDLPDAFTVASQQAFLDSVAALPGAVSYPSGLILIVETEGEGAMPDDTDSVKLMYSGKFYDGTEFDATSAPVVFRVSDVTPGFSEGLKLMRPGGRYRIVMPPSLAYGPEGIPGAIPGNAALDFTVDLISVSPK